MSRTAGGKGDTGEKGDNGEQEPKGEKGEKGDNGETPAITVVEDTPLSYKLNFKTSMEDITSPNLFKTLDEYHVDLSSTYSTLNIPLENLILTYQNTSTSSIRITIAAKDTTVPILTDIHRVTIYNGSSVESQTYNSTSVSTQTILVDLMYTNSQESHSRIRLQTSGLCARFILLVPTTKPEPLSEHNGARSVSAMKHR